MDHLPSALRDQWKSATGPALLLSAQLFVFLPIALYRGNEVEFQASLFAILKVCVVLAAVSSGTLAVIARFLPTRGLSFFISVLGAIAVSCWIQGSFLAGDYGVLDGEGIHWDSFSWKSSIDISMWIVFSAAAILFRERVARDVGWLCGGVFALQLLVAIPYLLGASKPVTELAMPAESFEYSDRSNVIHILLDAVQADLFAEILEKDPALEEDLDGFTWFRNTLGAFPRTRLSFPVIFADMTYEREPPMEFFETLNDRMFYNDLYEHGYSVHISPMVHPCMGRYTTCFRIPLPFDDPGTVPRAEALHLVDIALFRSVPHLLKRYVYNSQSWLISRLMGGAKDPSSQFRFFNHIRFLHEYGSRIRASDKPPSYHFLHLNGSHAPIVSNAACEYVGPKSRTRHRIRAQTVCVLGSLRRFLDNLRAIGVYASSTIVVHSDHGVGDRVAMLNSARDDAAHPVGINRLSKIVGKSLPLLLVKPAGASGKMKISSAPATLGDIPATVLASAGLPTQEPSVFDLSDAAYQTRTRYFHDQSLRHPYPVQRYAVIGDVYDVNSWKLDEVIFSPEPLPGQIKCGSRRALPSLIRGWFTQRESDGDTCWALGPSAALGLKLPGDSAVKLTARLVPWRRVEEMQVTVSIDGDRLGVWDVGSQPAGWHEYSLVIPADPARAEASIIELTFSHYERPGKRENPPTPIAVAFDWISTEPID